MANEIPTVKEVTDAEKLSYTEHDQRKWVVASGGRWQARKSLTDAVLALGCEPDGGILFVSSDFTVDPTFGSVQGSVVERVDLSDEDMQNLMRLCAYDALEKAVSLVEFVTEQDFDTGSIELEMEALMIKVENA